MQYTYLGRTGVQVSKLCFGTLSFGGEADADTSKELFYRCREAGINFFDCANVYNEGRAEDILGDLIAGERENIILTSKAYFPVSSDPNARGASRRHIQQEVEKSLKRLKTDYIDIYFIHHYDEHTPLEESLRALDHLVAQGKILYPGASNFAAWQIEKGLGISAREGLESFQCIQPMYNLVKRQAEVEILPMAAEERLGVITYSPLGGGLLTGKYLENRASAQGRFNTNVDYQIRYGGAQTNETIVRFVAFAREMGVEPAALAVAWVAGHPAVTAPILGARNLAQLDSSLKSVDVPMTAELRAEITALSLDPPAATDRTEERVKQ